MGETVVDDTEPVETDSDRVETDAPPVETDADPVETDSDPADSDAGDSDTLGLDDTGDSDPGIIDSAPDSGLPDSGMPHTGDTAPPHDSVAACPPRDLYDFDSFRDIRRAAQLARSMFDPYNWDHFLVEADFSCPTFSDSGLFAVEHYTGGCTTGAGATFGGELLLRPATSGAMEGIATDWSVEGGTIRLAEARMHGTSVRMGLGGSSYQVDFDGEWFFDRIGSQSNALPDGFVGQHTFIFAPDALLGERHVWTLRGRSPCGRAIEVDIDLYVNAHFNLMRYPNTGQMRVRMGANEASMDWSAELFPGCWDYVVNGVSQGARCGY